MQTTTYNLEKFSRRLSKYIDENRFVHTQGVRYISAALAMAHGVDIHLAETAGLLHDCAKCIPDAKKIKICEKNGLPVSDRKGKIRSGRPADPECDHLSYDRKSRDDAARADRFYCGLYRTAAE